MIFRREHIQMIVEETKTATRRLWKTPHAVEGKIHAVQERWYQKKSECPLILIKKVYRQKLGDMTEEDAKKEGGYTLEYFKRIVWPNCSGVAWDDNLEPFVIEFEHVKEVE